MPRSPGFGILFAPETLDHLDAIERKHHRSLQRAIDEQLTHTPVKPTRNRKPLEPPADFGATWELRCGPGNRFRVFYEVALDERTVWILAIGLKDGNRLLVGGGEIQL